MKIRLIIGGFILGVATALVTSQAISRQQTPASPQPPQETQPPQAPISQPPQPPTPEMVQAQVDQMIQAMGPNIYHQALQGTIGTWETTTRLWLQGPEQPPVERTGTSERRWMLDGRFVMEELATQFPISEVTDGMAKDIAWNGIGLLGYDNFRRMYTGCWADTMGTHLLTMKGHVNPEGTVFTLYGEMDEPSLPVVGRTVKYVLKVNDQDSMTFTIYDLHAGDDYRAAEVSYKRKK